MAPTLPVRTEPVEVPAGPEPAEAPLANLRVLDFSELLPGPFMTQSLVELGATVLKVERPPHGDNTRQLSAGLFKAVNRGKQSIVADLKNPAELARVRELAAQADVLVEAYRPGVMARLGLGWTALRALNPRLVYVSLTGFGQTGPNAQVPGHDVNYVAASGVAALSCGADGRPGAGIGVPVADLVGATYALAALNAALLQRERSGRGQHLDVAITDCLAHWMNPRLAAFHQAGARDAQAQQRLAHARAAYGIFRCADGRHLSIAALEDHFWRRLLGVFDLAPFDAPDYAHAAARQAQAQAINARLEAAVAALTLDEALRRCTEADLPAVPLVAPSELPESPQVRARALMQATPAGTLVRFPVRLDGMAPAPTEAPALGGSRWRLDPA